MESLVIEAGHAIGNIKLRMSEAEVQQGLRDFEAKYHMEPGWANSIFRLHSRH